jgi:hypothetical protein
LSRSTFKGQVNFQGLTKEEWRRRRLFSLENSRAGTSWDDERKQQFNQIPQHLVHTGLGPDAFCEINFHGAIFGDKADFSRRKLLRRIDFTRSHFQQPPDFGGCEGTQNLDFYGARVEFMGKLPSLWRVPSLAVRGWTTLSDSVLRLRTLRTLAEETKNHDLERDLYIEERRAERGILFAQYWRGGWRGRLSPRMLGHLFWLLITLGYSLLSDYGRSVLRPFAGLVASVFIFHWGYASVLVAPSDAARLEDFRRSVWAFAVSNAVPFVGALALDSSVKLTLLCGDRPTDQVTALQRNVPQCLPVPGRRFQLLVLLQSIFSALCVFFVALALRNYFKLK